MIASIRELCAQKGVAMGDTCYRNSCPEMLDFKIVSGDFYNVTRRAQGDEVLLYKNSVEILDFPLLTEQLPPLRSLRYSLRDSLPYFTDGLCSIARCMAAGEPVAVEGGPCLFGTDEVRVEVRRTGGQTDFFDYNTGKSYLEQGEAGMEFREFVLAHAGEIRALHFENRKQQLTPQEWAFLKYPFEAAAALSAPLVLPIPDFSYIKYLDAVLERVETPVRQAALEEFRAVAHEICDLYLDVIDRMRVLYPGVRCDVVHDRDTALCARYYAARAPYMERRKTVSRLTGIPEKREPVKDYVSMPALPYYLYGIPNIVEVDSMDETDSFRKCRTAHKQVLNLACLLFPELLSADRVHTIFDAPRDRKEYGNYAVE